MVVLFGLYKFHSKLLKSLPVLAEDLEFYYHKNEYFYVFKTLDR